MPGDGHYRYAMRRLAALTAFLFCTPGCFFFGAGPDGGPCDDDRFGCEAGQFEIDETCELEGELFVHVGGGEGGFTSLEEGEQPPVFSGAQGGQHTMIGVQIDNADLERYERLRVEIGIYPVSACTVEGEPCEGTPDIGERTVVLGDLEPLQVNDDGVVEEYGLVVFLGLPSEPEAVLQLEVEDPCGRYGWSQHRMSTSGIGF